MVILRNRAVAKGVLQPVDGDGRSIHHAPDAHQPRRLEHIVHAHLVDPHRQLQLLLGFRRQDIGQIDDPLHAVVLDGGDDVLKASNISYDHVNIVEVGHFAVIGIEIEADDSLPQAEQTPGQP